MAIALLLWFLSGVDTLLESLFRANSDIEAKSNDDVRYLMISSGNNQTLRNLKRGRGEESDIHCHGGPSLIRIKTSFRVTKQRACPPSSSSSDPSRPACV